MSIKYMWHGCQHGESHHHTNTNSQRWKGCSNGPSIQSIPPAFNNVLLHNVVLVHTSFTICSRMTGRHAFIHLCQAHFDFGILFWRLCFHPCLLYYNKALRSGVVVPEILFPWLCLVPKNFPQNSKLSITSPSHQNIKYSKWLMHGVLNVGK